MTNNKCNNLKHVKIKKYSYIVIINKIYHAKQNNSKVLKMTRCNS